MEVTAIRSYRENEGNVDKPRVLRLTFAQPIKQVDKCAIEIELAPADYPTFTQQFVDAVHAEMGSVRGEIMLDEAANDMLRKRVLEGVR